MLGCFGYPLVVEVVVYDNLVESLPHGEALSVIAHELAHAAHGDVVIDTALGALGGATGVGLLGLLVTTGSRRRRGPMAILASYP